MSINNTNERNAERMTTSSRVVECCSFSCQKLQEKQSSLTIDLISANWACHRKNISPPRCRKCDNKQFMYRLTTHFSGGFSEAFELEAGFLSENHSPMMIIGGRLRTSTFERLPVPFVKSLNFRIKFSSLSLSLLPYTSIMWRFVVNACDRENASNDSIPMPGLIFS